MKEFLEKYGVYTLALFLFFLGTSFYTRAYSYDHFAYDEEGDVYFFEHPLAIKHMDEYFQMQDIDTNHCAEQYFEDVKKMELESEKIINFKKQQR